MSKSEYQSTLKSSDTEEWFDLVFYRKVGYAWALLARKLGVTPNAITIASIFLGVGAGICFYYQNIWINIAGMLLLVWANSFDSADGQLARLTHQYSRLGRILDGVSGDFWFLSIYICICLREMHTPGIFMEDKWAIWVIAVAAGFCHSLQAAQADYYRQLHLFFVKGKEGSELDSSDTLKKKLAEMPEKGNFFQRLVLKFYIGYTVSQEKRTPAMQAMRKALLKKFNGGVPSAEFRESFRRASLPLMKYTNILSFNTRCFALFISIAIGIPWLYFAFELTVMNVLLIYMMYNHEDICRKFTTELNK
ncbi:MAG: CDP-alcohol phosphatidyltransferase family protein [Prevotella sp.]|nr:CDP-alcohol phosphatidyltransferase family protein [Prevotella sp.]MCM1075660.1 CDP-alcohol phosphatidyltransferase family protein [Ruminococcus sp.]